MKYKIPDIPLYVSSDMKLKAAKAKTGVRKIYIETYGCQMNVADSETVLSVMLENNFGYTETLEEADIIFINTCAIRDNAEQKIRNRLQFLNFLKKNKPELIIGILGCMAERLKEKLLEEEKTLDIVAGPDAYRSLPQLVEEAKNGRDAVNVLLLRDENYADISPIRKSKYNVSAFISVTRGCNNLCAFCVVPYTRGTERSRSPETILRELQEIRSEGYKEVTLLGQNVDKYRYKELNFAGLLRLTAEAAPEMRIRFATSYPKNFTDEVLHVMASYKNICKYIHLPVQSGSNAVLKKMKRAYTREEYLDRIASIKRIVPDSAISTDIIAGFCDETEQDHQNTLSLMQEVKFDYAYMFKYSERPDTLAAKRFTDNVPDEVKARRLQEIIELQQQLSLESNMRDVGKTFEVLAEGYSKKSDRHLFGRNSQNKVIIFPKKSVKPGDFVKVTVESCTSATLKGKIAEINVQVAGI